ncbi:Protein of unknown function [Gryllus bimaculatus]|nr:Protein of unknown function [Gryllus bimaculatus]
MCAPISRGCATFLRLRETPTGRGARARPRNVFGDDRLDAVRGQARPRQPAAPAATAPPPPAPEPGAGAAPAPLPELRVARLLQETGATPYSDSLYPVYC